MPPLPSSFPSTLKPHSVQIYYSIDLSPPPLHFVTTAQKNITRSVLALIQHHFLSFLRVETMADTNQRGVVFRVVIRVDERGDE